MKKWTTMMAVAMMFVSASLLGAQSNRAQEKALKLDFHLSKIHDERESGRLWGGGITLGLGVATALGVNSLANTVLGPYASKSFRDQISTIAYGTGGVIGGTGVLILLLKSEFETLPEKYTLMSGRSDEELAKKVIFGETALQSLSESAKNARYLSAGTMVVSGVALLAMPSSAGSTVSYSSLLYIGLGALNFFLESSPEVESRAYQRWAQRLN